MVRPAPDKLGPCPASQNQPLSGERLLSFRGAVRLYVGGERRLGDPADLVLRDRDQVVLQVGPFVTPHPSFTFRSPVT